MVKIIAPASFIPFRRDEIERSIPRCFEEQAARHADRLAVKTRHHQLNYEELNRFANRIAHALLGQCGNTPEPIATLLHPSPLGSASVLGILKAGKIWIPLNPTYPSGRLISLLKDSQASLILTATEHLPLARDLADKHVWLLNLKELRDGLSDQNPDLEISPDALAYIIYTSGSTGQPKGVVQNHRNVLHSMYLHTNSLCISPEDRLSLFSSYSHLTGVTATFRSLLNGAALFPFNIFSEGVDPIVDWLIENKISIYTSVPTIFRHIVDTLDGTRQFPHLRLIHLGGEMVSRRDVDLYKKFFPSTCYLLNNLGSTEVSMYRQFLMNKETTIEGHVVPVGYAVEDKEVLLLDEQGREVSPDQPGEIVVKSPYLALEYWRKPELTRQAFLPDPENKSQRLFRTGDIGRMLPDGCLALLGRKDSQVKIRGERIEINEIEAALLEHPGVKECAVVAWDLKSKEKCLVGYVVSNRNPAPPVSVLDAHLRSRFPFHMVPSSFVFLESLPKTPDGKVHHKSLPAPSDIRPALSSDFVSPRNAIEEKLTALWESILGVRPIGVKDNFFFLGGHSLLAARLCIHLGRQFGNKFSPATLFQTPTIEELANLIRANKESVPLRSLVVFRSEGSNPPFFCIPGNLGNVYTDFNYLAHHLGLDQPFYGLQDLAQNPSKIECLAARYIGEIRTVQPQEPYLIGGLCSGAFIAFEMARQIRAKGEKVALLALIEPPRPFSPGLDSYGDFVRAVLRRLFRRVGHNSQKVLLSNPSEKLDYLKLKLKQIANSWAMRNYQPWPYEDEMHLFLSKASLQNVNNPQLKWLKLSKRKVNLQEIPGNHNTITGYANTPIEEAHIMVLAEKLKACIHEWHLRNKPN
ncbi:MAG: AMP-binding protein [Candidatus Aminicenantales bacterium]